MSKLRKRRMDGQRRLKAGQSFQYYMEHLINYIDVQESGCLLWLCAKSDYRWGIVAVAGVVEAVHRILYKAYFNKILTPKITLHHTCKTTLCVSPLHLEELSNVNHTLLHNLEGQKVHPIHDRHDILQLYGYGLRMRDIAKIYGVERSTIRRVIRNLAYIDAYVTE